MPIRSPRPTFTWPTAFDQAADIVKLAMEREPDRRDLRLKLLEVYFVWSNKDAFLDVARELARDRDRRPRVSGDKVAIMGRQIAPDGCTVRRLGRPWCGHRAASISTLRRTRHTNPRAWTLSSSVRTPRHRPSADDLDLDLDKGAQPATTAWPTTGESLALNEGDLDLDLEFDAASDRGRATRGADRRAPGTVAGVTPTRST